MAVELFVSFALYSATQANKSINIQVIRMLACAGRNECGRGGTGRPLPGTRTPQPRTRPSAASYDSPVLAGVQHLPFFWMDGLSSFSVTRLACPFKEGAAVSTTSFF